MKIKDIVRFHSETTMPIPDVVYHLYSLPSFDNNQTREELLGQDIQSNKFTVPNRCILFNKLNVRFKRIWRIDSDEDHKIASTEFLPLIIDENKVDFAYCFYLLASPAITDYLCGQNANTSGSHKRIDPTNFFNIGIKLPPLAQQYEIGKLLSSLDAKIKLNRQINQNLEAMAKQLYNYWFVQFDFPNEEGKPYKSSGGEMLWNDKLKRNIPVGWHCGNLFEIAVFTNGLACQKFRPKDDEVPLPVIKIREMHDGISVDTEEVTSNIPESVKVYNGDVLFSWSASLEVMLWAYGLGGLNQHIFKITSANDFPKSFYYFQLLDYVDVFKKMAEARKTTMGHITQDHLQQSTIAIPDNKDIAEKFEELISPIFKQIVKLQEEISNLIKQRDELLPLLMNGQITIE
ncbi:restriction endonuclease subunit S [Bacteroides acidifaciens]|uniref:Restriction endonuclease subunit S n=1 Tax=Bacteroides acidifaciens TaxID=85831 RepID=A0A3L8A6B3_9BACE|nr:restriction endonuclease subunit S [Bacteroides acidifaciens]RLT78592.1 restriction endonuclease subunit S [Bacteroides acidifaciens]